MKHCPILPRLSPVRRGSHAKIGGHKVCALPLSCTTWVVICCDGETRLARIKKRSESAMRTCCEIWILSSISCIPRPAKSSVTQTQNGDPHEDSQNAHGRWEAEIRLRKHSELSQAPKPQRGLAGQQACLIGVIVLRQHGHESWDIVFFPITNNRMQFCGTTYGEATSTLRPRNVGDPQILNSFEVTHIITRSVVAGCQA